MNSFLKISPIWIFFHSKESTYGCFKIYINTNMLLQVMGKCLIYMKLFLSISSRRLFLKIVNNVA